MLTPNPIFEACLSVLASRETWDYEIYDLGGKCFCKRPADEVKEEYHLPKVGDHKMFLINGEVVTIKRVN